jgi:hypothetical protein
MDDTTPLPGLRYCFSMMRLAIAAGLIVVVVFIGVLSSGRSGGDTAELVDRIKGAFGAKSVPQPLTDCTVRRLEASLDNKKIEELYDSPHAVTGGTAAVLANPMVENALVKSGIACSLQLEESGRFNREELIEILRGLGKPS